MKSARVFLTLLQFHPVFPFCPTQRNPLYLCKNDRVLSNRSEPEIFVHRHFIKFSPSIHPNRICASFLGNTIRKGSSNSELGPKKLHSLETKDIGSPLNQKSCENDDIVHKSPFLLKEKGKNMMKTLVLILPAFFIFKYRSFVTACFQSLDISTLKIRMIGGLDHLNDLGIKGLIVYSILFSIWEILVGITTPVETAAGMAFGVKRGIIASAIGKLGGAFIAFLIGKFALQDYVRKKLEGNEMMDLVKDSIEENPIGVALIWRFSFLPEFMKNFGLALLPLKTIHFMTAVFLHGFPFTCLWTCLGAEAGKLARGVVSTPSQILKIMVGAVYVLGFFVSPALVGAWIKSLQKKRKLQK